MADVNSLHYPHGLSPIGRNLFKERGREHSQQHYSPMPFAIGVFTSTSQCRGNSPVFPFATTFPGFQRFCERSYDEEIGHSALKNTMNCKHTRISNHLRKYRKARGLSQRDAARILGYANSSRLSKWERGNCLPNSRNLFRLAAAYRTLVDALYIDVLRDVRKEVRGREEKILKHDGNAS